MHDRARYEAEQNDDGSLPTPIATLVTPDGREQPIYQPIPGFEHMFSVPSTQTTSRSSKITHVTVPQTPGKRRRSSARMSSPKELDDICDDGENEQDQDREVVKDESYTFYIGDIEQLQKFMRQRFNELTMKPLRGIVTNWIRLLEPRRLGAYGKYHEMLPSEMPKDATPPWWPKTIIYKEPSHLKKHDLLTLAVEVIFIHRKIDEIKRRESWVGRLRQIAVYAVETTAPDNFSSSKGSKHSEQMKQRALTAILPSLFEVAMSYENHIVQHSLYEGSGKADPGEGKYHTWQAIPRPARRPLSRKRAPRTMMYAGKRSECEGSVDEVSLDDSRAASTVEVQTPTQQTGASTPCQHVFKVDSLCTPIQRQQSVPAQHIMATSTPLFKELVHSVHIDEADEVDVKYVAGAPHAHPPWEVLPYSAYQEYEGPGTGFSGHEFQPIEQSAYWYCETGGLPFDQRNIAGYADQYHMYVAGYSTEYGFGAAMPVVADGDYGYGEYSMPGPF